MESVPEDGRVEDPLAGLRASNGVGGPRMLGDRKSVV